MCTITIIFTFDWLIGYFSRHIRHQLNVSSRIRVKRKAHNYGSARKSNWFLEIRERRMEWKRNGRVSPGWRNHTAKHIFWNFCEHFRNETGNSQHAIPQRFPRNLFLDDVSTGFASIGRLVLTQKIYIFVSRRQFFLILFPRCWWDHEVKSLAGCVSEFLLLTLAINRLLQVKWKRVWIIIKSNVLALHDFCAVHTWQPDRYRFAWTQIASANWRIFQTRINKSASIGFKWIAKQQNSAVMFTICCITLFVHLIPLRGQINICATNR